MLLAEKDVNDKGGVKGRPLKVLVEDDGSKADNAKNKAEQLHLRREGRHHTRALADGEHRSRVGHDQ